MTTHNQLINNSEKYIAELERALDKVDQEDNALIEQVHVVQVQSMSVAFTIERNRVIDVKTTNLLNATKLSKENAERVAKEVRNGHNQVGQAIHFRDALVKEIKDQEKFLEMIRGTM